MSMMPPLVSGAEEPNYTEADVRGWSDEDLAAEYFWLPFCSPAWTWVQDELVRRGIVSLCPICDERTPHLHATGA